MSIEDSHGDSLSPEATRIVSALIASVPRESVSSVDDDALIRLACGVEIPEEATEVLKALTRSAEIRMRYATHRQRANEYAGRALGSLEPASESDSRIVECLRTALAAKLRNAQTTPTFDLAQAWDRLRNRGSVEAARTRQLLSAVGASILQSRQRGAFAFTRSDSASRATIDLANGLSANLDIGSVDGGALSVKVELIPNTGADLASVFGSNLFLSMIDPSGGVVLLHSSPIQGAAWEVLLSDFESVAGIGPSDMSASDLRLSVNAPPRLAVPRRFLFIEVPEALRREDMLTIPLELLAPPHIRNGVLILEVNVPPEIPSLFSDARLDISIGFGASAQHLGSSELVDWAAGFLRIEIAIGMTDDGVIECGSMLQMWLSTSA